MHFYTPQRLPKELIYSHKSCLPKIRRKAIDIRRRSGSK